MYRTRRALAAAIAVFSMRAMEMWFKARDNSREMAGANCLNRSAT